MNHRKWIVVLSKDRSVDFDASSLSPYFNLVNIENLNAYEVEKVVYRHRSQDRTTVCFWVRDNRQLESLKSGYANEFTHGHLSAQGRKNTFFKSASSVLSVDVLDAKAIKIKLEAALQQYAGTKGSYCDVVIGGQYGSEGKGQVAAYLSHEYDILVRVGGPNAGHKVYETPKPYTFHLLPSGSRTNSNASIVIGPGAVLDEETILREIQDLGGGRDISIDPNCMLISSADKKKEAKGKDVKDRIGSTAQGVGVATARRILDRGKASVKLAGSSEVLEPYLRPTAQILEEAYLSGKSILLEGTQGSGLSLYHGEYPFVTSRETNVSGCLAEAGIPPALVRKVILVVRTFPIRVASPEGGTSGQIARECSWKDVAKYSGISEKELIKKEKTSTTRRDRRVGWFCWEQLRKACLLNMPTDIALTFVDYLDINNRDASRFNQLSERTAKFCREIEEVAGAPVSLLSRDFSFQAMLDCRRWNRR